MPQHVFISYKREDRNFVSELENRLLEAGIESWTDVQLKAGEQWRKRIDEAIENAFALVIVLTPEARRSEYVTYEWSYAMGMGIEIVPILLKGKDGDMHPKLADRHFLDFRDRYGEPWDELISRLGDLRETHRPRTIALPRDTPDSVRNAVKALDSHNHEDNLRGIRSLADNDHPAAAEALVAALQHNRKYVRLETLRMLGLLGRVDAIPAIIPLLRDPDRNIRHLAVTILGEFGNPSVAPDIVPLLRDEDRNMRRVAVEALGQLGNASVAPDIVPLLRDEDSDVRNRAVEVLGELGNASVAPDIVPCCEMRI